MVYLSDRAACCTLHNPQSPQRTASRHAVGRGSNTVAGDLTGPRHTTLSTWPIQTSSSSLQQLQTHTSHVGAAQSQSVMADVLSLYSLGQSVLSQGCVSMAFPVHPLPHLCGGGLLHRRMRVMLLRPHVVGHADQGDQSPQFPSAAGHESHFYLHQCFH